VLKITLSALLCQMTNVSGLGDFVTESDRLTAFGACGSGWPITLCMPKSGQKNLPVTAARDKLQQDEDFTGGKL
jgi:hypothetical protein